MRKKIVKIDPMAGHHLKLEFEDGTTQVLLRGHHLTRGTDGSVHDEDPKVGDMWPPAVVEPTVVETEPEAVPATRNRASGRRRGNKGE